MTDDDRRLIMSGWNMGRREGNLSSKSELSPVSNERCRDSYNEDSFAISMPNGVTDNLLCANFKSSESIRKYFHSKFLIQLNLSTVSDGVVYYYERNTFFVYAISGEPTGSNRPRLFTRVSNVIEWIESII